MAGARYRLNPKFINRNGYSFSFRAVLEPGGPNFMPTQTIVVMTERYSMPWAARSRSALSLAQFLSKYKC